MTTIEKEFVCECGKRFTNGQAFNGHKSSCKVHCLAKYGSLVEYEAKRSERAKKSAATSSIYRTEAKKAVLQNWLAKNPVCEHCGKVMTEKFGSGRFCSRACANSRERPANIRQKISISVATSGLAQQTKQKCIDAYERSPKYCKICNKKIEYDRRSANTCTNRECQIAWSASQSKGKTGGLRRGSGTGKHGWYKGYYCDSSYELAYVIYNLDHNISFERNKKAYSYTGIDNKIHKYYPDFIENDSLVEIKGYWTETVQRKLAAVDDSPIKLLMKKDIQYMIDYVKQAYNCSDITTLYES